MYDSYFYEPNEFEQQIEEFKNALAQSVRQEHKEKMDRLEKENRDLQEIKRNWDKIENEYKSKQKELEVKLKQYKKDASKLRLEELFGEVGMNVILFSPNPKSVYLPKCNKCDDKRYFHYVSPMGKDTTERCSCGRAYNKYSPIKYYLTEFRVNDCANPKEIPLKMWYEKYTDGQNDSYNYDSNSRYVEKVCDGVDFSKISGSYWQIFFKEKANCQAYCDWLNKKNDITDDMSSKE